MDMKFRTVGGEQITDIPKYIRNFMAEMPYLQHDIYVGCDSQVSSRYSVYATAIVIHRVGKGARVIYARQNEKKMNETRGGIFNRLYLEIEKAMEVIIYLKEEGFGDTGVMTVDFDFNALPKYASNMLYDTALGYATGQGLEARCKPDAFSATYAANRYCR